jgi:hypothetical protein
MTEYSQIVPAGMCHCLSSPKTCAIPRVRPRVMVMRD